MHQWDITHYTWRSVGEMTMCHAFTHSCIRPVRSPRIRGRTVCTLVHWRRADRHTDRSERHTAGRERPTPHSRSGDSRSTSRSQMSHPEKMEIQNKQNRFKRRQRVKLRRPSPGKWEMRNLKFLQRGFIYILEHGGCNIFVLALILSQTPLVDSWVWKVSYHDVVSLKYLWITILATLVRTWKILYINPFFIL